MRIVEPSQKSVRAGDVFSFVMPDGLHRFGRVIDTEARIGPMSGCVLLYIYDATGQSHEPLSTSFDLNAC